MGRNRRKGYSMSDKELEKFFSSITKGLFSIPTTSNSKKKVVNKKNKTISKKQLQESLEIKMKKLNALLEQNYQKITDLLKDTNKVEFDVNKYYKDKLKRQEYELYIPQDKPDYDEFCKENKVLRKNTILELILKNRKEKRLSQEINVKKIFDEKMQEYDNSELERKQEYIKRQYDIENEINTYNKRILDEQEMYIKRNPNEVEKVFHEYMKLCLEKNVEFNTSFKIRYNSNTDTCILEYNFPNISVIPKIKEYKYVKKDNEIKEKLFSEKERKKIYESFILKLTLKMINYAFDFDNGFMKNIIFNGKLDTVDSSTGKYAEFIILSVAITKEQFMNINLQRVEEKNCLKSLGMRYINDLSNSKNVVPFENVNLLDNTSVINNIDYNIDGFEFENLSKELLEANGFENVEVTVSSGDYGADVIAYKNDIKYAIQCKKFSGPVGVKAVQEVMGSKSVYNCHVAVVLTNSSFTVNARKLAGQNNVLLWDREKLKELIKNYERKDINE